MELPIDSIETPTIVDTLEAIASPVLRRRTHLRVKAVFDFAMGNDMMERNPADSRLLKFKVAVGNPEATNHPACPHSRIREVFAELDATPMFPATRAAARFAILTAARNAEAGAARWSEIDFADKTWRIPANRMKAGRSRSRAAVRRRA